MKKEKKYDNAFFRPETIKEAVSVLATISGVNKDELVIYDLNVTFDLGRWSHDHIDEFFADYLQSPSYVYFSVGKRPDYHLTVGYSEYSDGNNSSVSVTAPSRKELESIFQIFEDALPKALLPKPKLPPPPSPVIFIGHGRNPQWRDLKDHLHEQHDYEVIAYEIGARAGHDIRDILEEMTQKSTFAILVMTGEDEGPGGKLRARQNVIHEIGLFQGRLGFSRAIVLLEKGTEEFSNIESIHQLRFSKDNIREIFGDVLATLKREFE